MPEPKWVISMGACATSTGVFNNYALIPVNQVIPGGCLRPRLPAASRATDLRHHDAAEENCKADRRGEEYPEYRVTSRRRFLQLTSAASLCAHSRRRHRAKRLTAPRWCSRHNPVVGSFDPRACLSVGNGEFAFTADATGLQTFPELYNVIPLCTQSQWGWHSVSI